jgi:hypothetical protein
MRAAFEATLKDPEVLAQAARTKLQLNYVGADDVLKVLKEVLGQPKDVVDEFSKYVKFGE